MTDQQLDRTIDAVLPPASAAHGNAGHDDADTLARGSKLLRLRAARLTYDQIAQEMGYADRSSARHALISALERHEAENARELRALENLALDDDERTLRTLIADSSTPTAMRIRAIDARTRLSARRARLNGLDAPVQVAISAGVKAELEDALTEIAEVLELTQGADGVYAAEDQDPAE